MSLGVEGSGASHYVTLYFVWSWDVSPISVSVIVPVNVVNPNICLTPLLYVIPLVKFIKQQTGLRNKSRLTGFTLSFRFYLWSSNVRSNVLCPGGVEFDR